MFMNNRNFILWRDMMEEFSKIRICILSALILIPAIITAEEYTLEDCKAKAAAGVAEAQWQLGMRYETGDGVKKDSIRAITQYKKAAEQKHRQACLKLADLYGKGELVKKDPALAAKYKAWASNDNGELAAAKVKSSIEKSQIDEIEIAIDYILGRNGKTKDPKTGIRILYSQAKDKPAAQRAFVNRWARGDLDDALSQISDEEWSLVIPWFQDAYASGTKIAGHILGLESYRQKKYDEASSYWKAAAEAGSSKCWFFYAKMHCLSADKEYGGGPDYMQSDDKAKFALERYLKAFPNDGEAAYMLGLICNFSEDRRCIDYKKASHLFEGFLQGDSVSKWVYWNYGYSCFMSRCEFKFEKLIKLKRDLENNSYTRSERKFKTEDFQRIKNDCIKNEGNSIQYIKKASEMGCKSAQDFLELYNFVMK